MENAKREVKYDELQIEAYQLLGFVQPFPQHFHDFYVLGFLDGGRRYLKCKEKEYQLEKDDIVVFNPNDAHSCAQLGEDNLDYCAINIPIHVMQAYTQELTNSNTPIVFENNVIQNDEILFYLRELHRMIMFENDQFEKEETLLLLLSLLVEHNTITKINTPMKNKSEVDLICEYMQAHYTQRITLAEICNYIGVSKSTLLRLFIREKEMTPYRYLESLRINEAKRLLANGHKIQDVALQTGFCDQSHFTNYFTSLLGISPALYKKQFEGTTYDK